MKFYCLENDLQIRNDTFRSMKKILQSQCLKFTNETKSAKKRFALSHNTKIS